MSQLVLVLYKFGVYIGEFILPQVKLVIAAGKDITDSVQVAQSARAVVIYQLLDQG
jgi:hypothetical protein